jgi:formylglycine-generating enzyme required for sulfatase activity
VRAGRRDLNFPDDRDLNIGFRLAQDIEKIEAESNAEAERKSEEELAALRQKQEQPKGVWTEPVTGMRFVEVPSGSFEIGDQFDEGNKDEKSGWFYGDVDIQPFWLGATEVTQAQWQAIMDSNPSQFKGDDRPVEEVSFNDVQKFIKKLNARTGKRFRLPTEAEWEYACREGGKKVRFCNGKDEASKSGIHYTSSKTKPVASFSPNSLGLYDMSGNVWEWTCSEYKKSYDGSEQECAVSAEDYSLRGGSWDNGPWWVRAALRYVSYPDFRYYGVGFRLAQD